MSVLPLDRVPIRRLHIFFFWHIWWWREQILINDLLTRELLINSLNRAVYGTSPSRVAHFLLVLATTTINCCFRMLFSIFYCISGCVGEGESLFAENICYSRVQWINHASPFPWPIDWNTAWHLIRVLHLWLLVAEQSRKLIEMLYVFPKGYV